MTRKICFSIIFIMLSFVVLPQKSTPKATMKVTITDFNNKILPNKTVLFESQKTKAVIKATSDKDGKFIVELPGGQEYLIKVEAVGTDQEQQIIEIPPLNANETNVVYEMQIEYLVQHFTLDRVYFDTGKATLKKESYPELIELKEYLEEYPTQKIEVGGHTDDVGEDESNMILSQKRAEAVRNYLIKNKIKANRISAKGYGESRPVVINNSPENRQKNRRTEVKLLD